MGIIRRQSGEINEIRTNEEAKMSPIFYSQLITPNNGIGRKSFSFKSIFILQLVVILSMLLSGVSYVLAADHCVRASATGRGDGSSWTDAYTSLPASLVRGDTYYISAGLYPPYIIDDTVDGDKYITIKKATSTAHGTDTGWLDEYGDGVAEWTGTGYLIEIRTDYIIFDGVTGGGPRSWSSGHGFKLYSTANIIPVINLGNRSGSTPHSGASHIMVSHCELYNTQEPVTAGWGQGITATIGTFYSDITISYCYIHNIGGPHIKVINTDGIEIAYNYIAYNASSTTAHGVGIRFDYTKNATIRYNVLYHIWGTGNMGYYDGSVDDGKNFDIYGNVFMSADDVSSSTNNNGVIYSNSASVNYLSDWNIHNNTFYNWSSPKMIFFGGVEGYSELHAYNNLFYDIAGDVQISSNIVHDFSVMKPQTIKSETYIQEYTSTIPFNNPSTKDFSLKLPTESGKTLPSPYNVDMYGNIRGADGVWDRGAIEVTGEFTLEIPGSPSKLMTK
jgi:hypothetical protein